MKIALVVAATLVFSACASGPKPQLENHLPAALPRAQKVGVAFHSQARYLCGPTVLQMAAQDLAPLTAAAEYKALTFTDAAHGTYKSEMLSATRRLGLAPYRVPGIEEALQLVSDEQPVIVFLNLGLSWWPVWHYALLVGYDAVANEVILHSGPHAFQRLSFVRFYDSWVLGGKWSYIVVKPDQVPRLAAFDEVLDNAMVFERIRRPNQARELYEQISRIWPRRFEGPMGLANIAFAEGDKGGAIRFSRTALERDPFHPDLKQNLAFLLGEKGTLSPAKSR